MEYVLAQLYDAGGIISKDPKHRWYVYYKIQDSSGKLVPRHKKAGINKFKTAKERRAFAKVLIEEINKELVKGMRKGNTREDFYWWFNEKLKAEKAKPESFYNWRKLNAVYNKLIKFAPELSIHDIDYKFLKDLESHLIKNGDSPNYVADTFSRISSIMKTIVRSGDVAYHLNPFNDFKTKTTKVIKTRITIEDIERLENVFLKDEYEDLARDMYIFSFYLAGMRFGDICRVKKDWFKKDRADYVMNKAKNERSIKLLPQVIRIITKYKRIKGEYLFPTRVDWDNELKSINSRNVFYNRKLKEACKRTVVINSKGTVKKEPIPEVTFHTARHSFADLAKSKNIDIHTIKDLLGHSKVQTTEIYMKSFYKEETDEAMDKIFGKENPIKNN